MKRGVAPQCALLRRHDSRKAQTRCSLACRAGLLLQRRQLDRLNSGHLGVVKAAPYRDQGGEDRQNGDQTHY